jgi:CheY-like chemotaxis protein
VKQSGGHVKIYSEVGDGTTVKLYLPRTRKAQEGLAALTTGPIERGTETILVVEDDEGVRAAVVDMLSDLGYHVLKADNAQAALVVLSSGARIDLLFTDVVMPGPMPTRELARRAKELHPDIQVLFTSGYTQNAIVHNGRLDDDVFLLSKPYRRDDLARKLRSLLVLPKGEASRTASQQTATAKRAVRKVLVVEDVALIRMSTIDMVEQLGLETLEAGSAPEAIEILTAEPRVDVLLTDLGLRGMSGRELADEAKKINPDILIVIASGYSSDHEPGLAHLMKPFTLDQLRSALGV